MNSFKLLLVDDDPTLLDLLSDHLEVLGHSVHIARDGREGLRVHENISPDLVVLDVMMPKMDGWEVCARIREKSDTPIILLTAKNQELDKLRGFDLGVDDYVTKPFSFAELAARIRAVMARNSDDLEHSQLITVGDVNIDLNNRKVMKGDSQINLTPTEYKLLETLSGYFGRPVPTEKILADVWGPEYATEKEHVKHYIWSLRKKIEDDPGDPNIIITERGYGYRLG